jgi:pimeloyl-ACP methyl ester carboxylesterase
MFAMLAAAVVAAAPITAAGPNGPLAGTLLEASRGAPAVLVLPGSGPSDRDGNNPLGVTAAPYRLLAEALADKGVSSVRVDKRGLFGSKAAVPDANKVTIGDYASDTRKWIAAIRERLGLECVWVLGHSEGALIALAAAQEPRGLCGVILIAGAGKRLSDVIREQLRANPANASILEPALSAVAALEKGQHVEVRGMDAALQRLFAPKLQDYFIDLFAHDPAKLAAGTSLPMLIVQGERDIQVSVADARLLAAAQPKAKLVLLPRMNHVLKDVDSGERQANLATYADPSLPVDPGLVDAITAFVKR